MLTWVFPSPDPSLTPGTIDPAATAEKVCQHGYSASVRHVSEAMKRAVVLEYHAECSKRHPCEIDHLVSLELGGSNEMENLWPEFYCPLPREKDCFGAREKDVVENALHRRVCDGEISLREAQEVIRKDWIKEYRRLKGASLRTRH